MTATFNNKLCCGFAFLAAMTGLLPAAVSAQARHRYHTTPDTDFAYIINSGSGRIPGYRIYVGAGGKLQSAVTLRNGTARDRRRGYLIPPQTRRFFSDLKTAMPLAALRTGRRAPIGQGLIRDTAPGIHITLRYHGQQSPDLRQVSSASGKQLYQDVKHILAVLRQPVPNVP